MSEIGSSYSEVDKLITKHQLERIDNIVDEVTSKHKESTNLLYRIIKGDVLSHYVKMMYDDESEVDLDKDHQQKEHSIIKGNIRDFLVQEKMELTTKYNKIIDLFSKGIITEGQDKIKSAFIEEGDQVIVDKINKEIALTVQAQFKVPISEEFDRWIEYMLYNVDGVDEALDRHYHHKISIVNDHETDFPAAHAEIV